MAISKESKTYLLLGVLSIIWGSSFMMMEMGLKGLSVLQVAAIRMMAAALILIPIVIKNYLKIAKSDYLLLAISGFTGMGIPAYLFPYAQTQLDSGISGVLNSITPIWVLLISLIFFNVKTNKMSVFGIFIGLVGALIIVLNQSINITDINYATGAAAIIATVFYGINVNLLKYKLNHLKPLVITAFSALACAIPYSILFLMSDYSLQNSQTIESSYYVILLGTLSTAFAVILFNYLINMSSVIFASSVTYFIPIVSIIIGILWMDEIISIKQIVGIILIFSSVIIIKQGNKRHAKTKNKRIENQ